MTDPKGNSEFCFPETLNVSRGEAEKKKMRRNRLLDAGWLTDLPRFQGARPDHVQVESSSCYFSRELVSFDPRHLARSLPIGKRISVGRYYNVTFTVQ